MIRQRMLRLEQTLERVFGGKPPREPLEIRRAVIEATLAQVHPVGRGRKILPFSRATVHVVAADAAGRRVMKDALDPDALSQELQRELHRIGAEVPAGFQVQLRLVREPGKTWASGARFHVTVSQAESVEAQNLPHATAPASAASSDAAAATVVMRVLEGEARPRTLTSAATRINIGRQVSVLDRDGRPVRHNDLAFVGEDEVSRSVSRAHAHISFDRVARTHRLFDENSAYGTEVERQGRRIVVPPGRDGLKLRPGDQVRVGRAILRFDIK